MPDELGETPRLEGSRLIILQLYRSVAGGSRERLHVMQFLSAVAFSLQRNRYDGENITLGYSREPPVLARFCWISVITNVARGTRFAPKRLPSRRWAMARATPEPIEDGDDPGSDAPPS